MLLRGLRIRRLLGRIARFGLYNIVGVLLAIMCLNLLFSQGVLKSLVNPIFANSNLVDNKSDKAVQEGGFAEDGNFASTDTPGGEYFDVRVGTTIGSEQGSGTNSDEDAGEGHKITLSALLVARPIELVAERQSVPFPVVRLTPAEAKPLRSAADKFLPVWETFSAGTATQTSSTITEGDGEQAAPIEGLIDERVYRRNLSAVIAPNTDLDRMVARYDSHAPDTVGVCARCDMGSQWTDAILPSDLMVIHAYEPDKYAFVSTQGIVVYTGPGPFSGLRYRRSYSLVLVHALGSWRVQRAVADTLGRA
jgi:hypothetical protein